MLGLEKLSRLHQKILDARSFKVESVANKNNLASIVQSCLTQSTELSDDHSIETCASTACDTDCDAWSERFSRALLDREQRDDETQSFGDVAPKPTDNYEVFFESDDEVEDFEYVDLRLLARESMNRSVLSSRYSKNSSNKNREASPVRSLFSQSISQECTHVVSPRPTDHVGTPLSISHFPSTAFEQESNIDPDSQSLTERIQLMFAPVMNKTTTLLSVPSMQQTPSFVKNKSSNFSNRRPLILSESNQQTSHDIPSNLRKMDLNASSSLSSLDISRVKLKEPTTTNNDSASISSEGLPLKSLLKLPDIHSTNHTKASIRQGAIIASALKSSFDTPVDETVDMSKSSSMCSILSLPKLQSLKTSETIETAKLRLENGILATLRQQTPRPQSASTERIRQAERLRDIANNFICQKDCPTESVEHEFEEQSELIEGKCCSICLDSLKRNETNNDQKATALPCGHVFHNFCVGSWLKVKRNCPLCKSSVDQQGETIEDLGEIHERILDIVVTAPNPVSEITGGALW
eukprot:GDKK01046899.1.p1 GENE.GDKK01046899.1~~GDKK01046899.1.p1  ORF type:complete len:524 (-),score=60.88 GDKK01046899.1:86-1657(-)